MLQDLILISNALSLPLFCLSLPLFWNEMVIVYYVSYITIYHCPKALYRQLTVYKLNGLLTSLSLNFFGTNLSGIAVASSKHPDLWSSLYTFKLRFLGDKSSFVNASPEVDKEM